MLSRLTIKSAILCFTLVASAAALRAQNEPAKPKPDLSGTWLLDVKRSNSAGLTSRPDLPIKITHVDPELRLTLTVESNGQVVERNLIYFTDGRGEENTATALLTTNPKSRIQIQRTSRTDWRDNKVVIRSLLRLTTAGSRVEKFELVHEWKLSSDGRTLTHTTKTLYMQSAAGDFIPVTAPEEKRVYNRV